MAELEQQRLEKEKEEIINEFERINRGTRHLVCIPSAQKESILQGLKDNYQALNNQYQKMSLVSDTVPKIIKYVLLIIFTKLIYIYIYIF